MSTKVSRDNKATKAIKNALSKTVSGKHNYTFRSSNLPFCGRAYAISHFLNDKEEALDQELSHSLQCIFDTGNAVHSATQLWLGMAGLLLGHWKCLAISKDNRKEAEEMLGSTKSVMLKKVLTDYVANPICGQLVEQDYLPGTKKAKHKKCPGCGNKDTSLWRYVEFTLTDPKTGMSAHNDGYMPKYKALLEFKSTSLRRLRNKQYPHRPAWKHWMYQASVYAARLQEKYGYSVKRIVLVYFEREAFTYKIYVLPVMRHVLKTTRATFRDAQRKVRLRVLPSRICNTVSMGRKEMWCAYADICFSPSLSKQLGLNPDVL